MLSMQIRYCLSLSCMIQHYRCADTWIHAFCHKCIEHKQCFNIIVYVDYYKSICISNLIKRFFFSNQDKQNKRQDQYLTDLHQS